MHDFSNGYKNADMQRMADPSMIEQRKNIKSTRTLQKKIRAKFKYSLNLPEEIGVVAAPEEIRHASDEDDGGGLSHIVRSL